MKLLLCIGSNEDSDCCWSLFAHIVLFNKKKNERVGGAEPLITRDSSYPTFYLSTWWKLQLKNKFRKKTLLVFLLVEFNCNSIIKTPSSPIVLIASVFSKKPTELHEKFLQTTPYEIETWECAQIYRCFELQRIISCFCVHDCDILPIINSPHLSSLTVTDLTQLTTSGACLFLFLGIYN